MPPNRRPPRALSSAVLALSLLPGAAAAYCAGWDKDQPDYDPAYYSAHTELKRSEYVVMGTVVHETWLGDDGKPKPLQPPFQYNGKRPWGFDPYSGALYEIRVTRAIKGSPPERLTLFSENSTARFWLEVGRQYLVFVSRSNFDVVGPQLTMDTCGNSGPLKSSRRVLRQITKNKR